MKKYIGFKAGYILIVSFLIAGSGLLFSCEKGDTYTHVDGATLWLSPELLMEFGVTGGERFVTVETNQHVWDAVPNVKWMTIDKVDNGFMVTCTPNNSASSREDALITVTAGTQGNIVFETLAVKQYGLDEAYVILTPSGPILFTYNGGTVDIAVETNQRQWAAVSDQQWCVVDVGDGGFTVTAAGNDSQTDRLPATVTVTAGPEYNSTSSTLTVQQQGKPDVVGTDLSDAGTSNCYVVGTVGNYYFNGRIMGNNSTVGSITPSPLEPASVELLWQDYFQGGEGLIKTLRLSDEGYVTFATHDTFHTGNAVVAVKDADGKIVWSWHLWFIDDLATMDVADATKGSALLYTVIDRHVGAWSAIPGGDRSLGLLYQWGRKDPFIGSAGKGNTERTSESTAFLGSTVTDRSATAYTYDMQGRVNNSTDNMVWKTSVAVTEASAAVNAPTTFIFADKSTSPYTNDWFVGHNNEFWGNPWQGEVYYPAFSTRPLNSGIGRKTIYDPCPAGYRVAPMDLWVKAGVVKGNTRVEFDAANYGYKFKVSRTQNEYLWFPLAGYRESNDGQLASAGSAGFQWYSSPVEAPDKGESRSGATVSSSAIVLTTVGIGSDRARAYPIRCIKE